MSFGEFSSCALIVVLACVGAFLSANETALTAASRTRLHHLGTNGDERARLVLGLQGNISPMISAILLVNTWVLTYMSTLFTSLFMTHFGATATFYLAGLFAALVTIYVEVMPKIAVFGRAEKIAMRSAKILFFLKRVLSPATLVVESIARGSLQLLNVKPAQAYHSTSTIQELRGAIDLHAGSAHLTHERTMLRSILDLTQTSVYEVMVHRNEVFCVNVNEPATSLIDKVLKSPYTRIPLWEKNPDNIVGVLHTKALFRALKASGDDPSRVVIRDIMALPWFIPDTITLFSQLQAFRERRAHLAFVVDEYGSLQGMLTLEDILEEIVGDIEDEHDVELPGVRLIAPHRYWIKGTVSLKELKRRYDWKIPDDHPASTLAGLVIQETGCIPFQGQTFRFYQLEFKILKRHRYQITLIEVRVPETSPASLPSV